MENSPRDQIFAIRQSTWTKNIRKKARVHEQNLGNIRI